MLFRSVATVVLYILVTNGCSSDTTESSGRNDDTRILYDGLVTNQPTTFFMFPVGAEGQRIYYSVSQKFNNLYTEGYCSDGSGDSADTCAARWRYGHSGLDINGNGGGNTDCGDPVFAAADGVVVEAQNKGGWGNIVRIKHATTEGDRYTLSGHLQTINVIKDQVVTMGQKVGEIGNGGVSTACHLHFGVLTIDEAAQGYYYGTPPTTLLDPESFVTSRLPYKLDLATNSNPHTCDTEPTKAATGYLCNKRTDFNGWDSSPIYSLLRVNTIGLDICIQARYFKDGAEQKDLQGEACSTGWGKSGIVEKGYFWSRIPSYAAAPGSWRTEFRIKVKKSASEYAKIATAIARFTVRSGGESQEQKDMAAPSTKSPPPPPRPINQTFYVFAGIKHTCDRPIIKDAWWSEYRCSGSESFSALGSTVYGLVKIHYVAPNIRYRFVHELYYNGKLEKTIDTLTWISSGWYGQSEAYSFFTIDQTTLGRLPDSGTWTIRSSIVIDGKFTNWITDQTVTVF